MKDVPPPPPRPVDAPNPRPGAKGIWIGITMMVLAVVIPAVVWFLVWRPFATADMYVPADGEPHSVQLPADSTHGLFLQNTAPAACEATDAGGEGVDLGPVSGTYNIDDRTADSSFDTEAGGEFTFVCEPLDAGDDSDVLIAPLPSIGVMVLSLLGSCGLGVVLGIGGLVLLILTLLRPGRRG